MDYQLMFLIIGVIVLTGGALFTIKQLKTKGYTMTDVQSSLNITHLVLRFIRIALSRRMKDSLLRIYYTDLIIDAVEYLQTLSADLPLDKKINMAMESIYKASDKLKINLTNEEKVIIQDVLLIAYDMYVSLELEK